jgi:hypothetical protein
MGQIWTWQGRIDLSPSPESRFPHNRAMHLLIPYAASHAQGCQALTAKLKLPRLQKLLSLLVARPPDKDDEFSWSPPHERALAKARGLPNQDGLIPWAAFEARQHAGLVAIAPSEAWAFVTLCHWQASTFEVSMRQIPMPDLTGDESDALLAAMAPFFEQDSIKLYPLEPGRCLARGAVFANLRTASPDRVQGRNLEPWMPGTAEAGGLIRLVSEMQMLLYTHPVNDAREARGALPANALWFSGAGTLPAAYSTQTSTDDLQVINDLKEAALCEDWSAWAAAWQTLDATLMADLLADLARGEPVQLTLCGERHAQTWLAQPLGLIQMIKAKFVSQPLSNLLKSL